MSDGTGTTPGGRGRFPGFDVLREAGHWDDVTRAVVLERLRPPGPAAFFTPDEEAVARVLLDLLMGQHEEPRIPLLEPIDARLRAGEGDGYRYDGMPDDGEAWKRSLAALDEDARARHGRPFVDLPVVAQRELVESVREREEPWHGMPGRHTFSLWMRYAINAFYAHPWAWNEIGFPGPAYPRGYKTLAVDRLEPFERREVDPRDPIPWLEKVEAARRAHRSEPA